VRQQTVAAQTGFEKYGRKSKREQFLEEMEQSIPWAELQALIEPLVAYSATPVRHLQDANEYDQSRSRLLPAYHCARRMRRVRVREYARGLCIMSRTSTVDDWQMLYHQAILEPDPKKLSGIIDVAYKVIQRRAFELWYNGAPATGERQDLDAALSCLELLRGLSPVGESSFRDRGLVKRSPD